MRTDENLGSLSVEPSKPQNAAAASPSATHRQTTVRPPASPQSPERRKGAAPGAKPTAAKAEPVNGDPALQRFIDRLPTYGALMADEEFQGLMQTNPAEAQAFLADYHQKVTANRSAYRNASPARRAMMDQRIAQTSGQTAKPVPNPYAQAAKPPLIPVQSPASLVGKDIAHGLNNGFFGNVSRMANRAMGNETDMIPQGDYEPSTVAGQARSLAAQVGTDLLPFIATGGAAASLAPASVAKTIAASPALAGALEWGLGTLATAPVREAANQSRQNPGKPIDWRDVAKNTAIEAGVNAATGGVLPAVRGGILARSAVMGASGMAASGLQGRGVDLKSGLTNAGINAGIEAATHGAAKAQAFASKRRAKMAPDVAGQAGLRPEAPEPESLSQPPEAPEPESLSQPDDAPLTALPTSPAPAEPIVPAARTANGARLALAMDEVKTQLTATQQAIAKVAGSKKKAVPKKLLAKRDDLQKTLARLQARAAEESMPNVLPGRDAAMSADPVVIGGKGQAPIDVNQAQAPIKAEAGATITEIASEPGATVVIGKAPVADMPKALPAGPEITTMKTTRNGAVTETEQVAAIQLGAGRPDGSELAGLRAGSAERASAMAKIKKALAGVDAGLGKKGLTPKRQAELDTKALRLRETLGYHERADARLRELESQESMRQQAEANRARALGRAEDAARSEMDGTFNDRYGERHPEVVQEHNRQQRDLAEQRDLIAKQLEAAHEAGAETMVGEYAANNGATSVQRWTFDRLYKASDKTLDNVENSLGGLSNDALFEGVADNANAAMLQAVRALRQLRRDERSFKSLTRAQLAEDMNAEARDHASRAFSDGTLQGPSSPVRAVRRGITSDADTVMPSSTQALELADRQANRDVSRILAARQAGRLTPEQAAGEVRPVLLRRAKVKAELEAARQAAEDDIPDVDWSSYQPPEAGVFGTLLRDEGGSMPSFDAVVNRLTEWVASRQRQVGSVDETLQPRMNPDGLTPGGRNIYKFANGGRWEHLETVDGKMILREIPSEAKVARQGIGHRINRYLQPIQNMSAPMARAIVDAEAAKTWGDVRAGRVEEKLMAMPVERRADMHRSLDDPTNVGGHAVSLTASESDLVKRVATMMSEVGKAAEKRGLIKRALDVYAPHLYWEYENPVFKRDEQIGRIVSDPAKGRKYQYLHQAEAAGLTPIYDIATALNLYTALQRKIAAHDMIQSFRNMTNAAGERMAVTTKKGDPHRVDDDAIPKGYESVNVPGLRQYYVDPEIKSALVDIVGQNKAENSGVYRAIMKAKQLTIGLQLIWPAIHVMNVKSKATLKGGFTGVTNPLHRFGIGPDAIGSESSVAVIGARLRANDAELQDAVLHGVKVQSNRLKSLEELTGSLIDTGISAKLRDWANSTAVIKQVKGAADALHQFTWSEVEAMQLGLYKRLSDEMIAKGIDAAEAKYAAADAANVLMGMLPKHTRSELTRVGANLALYSQGWTLGNVRMTEHALRSVAGNLLRNTDMARGALRPDLRNEAGDEVVKLMRNSLAVDALISRVYLNLANKLMHAVVVGGAVGGAGVLNTLSDPMQGWAFQNEKGKKDRILIGRTDDPKDPAFLYGQVPFAKWADDPLGVIPFAIPGVSEGQPLEHLNKKLSPGLKSALELYSNEDGRGQEIYDKTAPFGQKAMAGAAHFLYGQSPLSTWSNYARSAGQIAASEPASATVQVLGNLLGASQSRGVPGGPEVAAFYDENKRIVSARKFVDHQARELVKAGKPVDAFNLLRQAKSAEGDPLYLPSTARSRVVEMMRGPTARMLRFKATHPHYASGGE